MTNYIIIAITCGISYWAWQSDERMSRYTLVPYLMQGKWNDLRIISHAFLHADWSHLLVNMLVLFSFGNNVLTTFEYIQGKGSGTILYLALYTGAIVAAALPALIKHKNNHHYVALGASGAVSAVTFSSILFYPTSNINFIFLPFLDIPAFIFGILYLAYEYFMDKRSNDNVAHDAHFWGALFGVVFTALLFPSVLGNFFEQVKSWLSI